MFCQSESNFDSIFFQFDVGEGYQWYADADDGPTLNADLVAL